ncbi:ribonucleoside-triphosphate reductase, adenosylcobalamin-dependent [Sinanaerobacter chloroacetimidivorans]|uniref:Adenosylcobalamin-dependent ribonucleoside-triphosphate reductase n=1 Tax=Sinanaerobacter chloroacetimidivorans TaxID=2818044 RepID=A0A8J7W4B4_9FIRM|nr:ribonucleoside-triphosphate reductase, adenosylcobalamin-dependent [Sinanaerobacter chloroacetimidivorans]MBR0598831.1 ribonucleoside-triphosphate reductase, adenosylcobalamin-dependent [Sinanaerobacter chloroacetimidivorans]
MKSVIKRDGTQVTFHSEKIKTAIENAMQETKIGINEKLAGDIAAAIEKQVEKSERTIHVEDLQDLVEDYLMASDRKDAAKKFIIYRYERDKTRDARKRRDGRIISDEFVSKYKHAPSPMSQLGSFVYYRTYSRWISEEMRREYWWETVRRSVEYNCSLVPTSKEEAEKLYKNIFELKQFLSGRTFWVGSTDVSKYYPMSNYNCSFQVIDSFAAFRDIFYLLMVGSGVGVRVLKSDVEKLPPVRTDVEIIHESYTPMLRTLRQDSTSLEFTHNDTVKITIGDSKEGWVQSMDYFLKALYSTEYRKIKTIILNYDHVRSKGEKLKTFGGTASGHSSMKNMFIKINKVIEKAKCRSTTSKVKLKPIDCLDIANIIGENVVVGGVRRTAEIVLIDQDDKEAIQAKSELYKKVDEKWVIDSEISHRQMSNNSIFYQRKPTRQELHWHLQQMRYSGEPGWVNEEAGAKRRPDFKGVNPCAEILLDSKGLCNLTTVNVMAFVIDGKLDYAGLMEAQRLSARAGYRMTCTELEIPEWNAVQQRDKLLGCSLTGWQDMVNALQLDQEGQEKLLLDLKQTARHAASEYAKELGQAEPLLITTIKPEGTLSLLPVVSSGVHFSHAPYYVRRVRISSDDPLTKVCEELGYPVYPEVGQDHDTCVTKVVEFPVKAPEGKFKSDVSAIEQLEIYKMFMNHYVEHNCSITVHVRDDEWDAVEQWVWDHWDDIVALSFLSFEDNFYELLPFEAISEKEYHKRAEAMKSFIPSLISKYEKEEVDYDIGNEGCEGGVCPIR